MSQVLGAPDLLRIPMTDGTLTPDVGSLSSSLVSNDNDQWVWDPDQNKYRQWSGPLAARVPYSSLGIRVQPASINRLTSYNRPGVSEELKKLAPDADVINIAGIRVDVYSAGTAPRVHRLSVDDATTDANGVLKLNYDAIGLVGESVSISVKLPDGRTVHADVLVKSLVD